MSKKRLTKKQLKALDKKTWSLDIEISKMCLPLFKRFRHNFLKHVGHAGPEALNRDKLNKIIYALNAVYTEQTLKLDLCIKKQKRIQEGLELFGKHFQELWW
jgi:hypothetical protein